MISKRHAQPAEKHMCFKLLFFYFKESFLFKLFAINTL